MDEERLFRIGDAVEIDNPSPCGNASRKYIAVWLEDDNGNGGGRNLRCLLFTRMAFFEMPVATLPSCFSASQMKAGRIYSLNASCVRCGEELDMRPVRMALIRFNGEDRVRLLSWTAIDRAENAARVAKKECLPKLARITALMEE